MFDVFFGDLIIDFIYLLVLWKINNLFILLYEKFEFEFIKMRVVVGVEEKNCLIVFLKVGKSRLCDIIN